MCFWQTLCFVLWAEARCWEVHPGCFLFPKNVCVCHNDVPNTWGLKQKRTLSFRFLCASEPGYDHSQEVTTLRASAACWCCSELVCLEHPQSSASSLPGQTTIFHSGAYQKSHYTILTHTYKPWRRCWEDVPAVRGVCGSCLQIWTKESSCMVVRT